MKIALTISAVALMLGAFTISADAQNRSQVLSKCSLAADPITMNRCLAIKANRAARKKEKEAARRGR